MAAIAASQVSQLWSDGTGPAKTVLWKVVNVTTADTLDTVTAGMPTTFNRLSSAAWIPTADGAGATFPSGGAVVGTLGNGASGVNNKVTFTLASMASATVLLLASGNPAA